MISLTLGACSTATSIPAVVGSRRANLEGEEVYRKKVTSSLPRYITNCRNELVDEHRKELISENRSQLDTKGHLLDDHARPLFCPGRRLRAAYFASTAQPFIRAQLTHTLVSIRF